jgi:hypothetical protein
LTSEHQTSFVIPSVQEILAPIVVDDPNTLEKLGYTIDQLSQVRFAKNMTILNLAIDKEATKCVQWIADKLRNKPSLAKALLEWRYNEHGVQVVH